jgi:hypothetical protein
MAWVGLVSAAVSMAGSLMQGAAEKSQAEQQAVIDRQNADIAEQEGESQADAIRLKARRIAGENRAAIGASGVDISGSFMDALQDSDIESELDAQTAEYNGRAQARNYRLQAGADQSSGTGALIGGFANAGAAGTNAVSSYGNWKLLDK